MTTNMYAPPKANVEGPVGDVGPVPALWNPNAAASWSLLLTPVFGTWLHWKNWQAMGEAERARTAGRWLIAALVVEVLSIGASGLLPRLANGSVLRIINFGFLIAWYYAAAKPQVRHVLGRFGTAYVRRGWLVPILAAIAAIIVVVGLVAVLARLGG